MRILIATDAWYPQVNGVVRTLEETARELRAMGHQVLLLTPEGHASIPLPLYSEIRLAIPTPGHIARAIEAFTPDAIYIATEGLIGLAARRWCLRHGMRFATGFHTRFPEFAAARLPLPGIVAIGYEFLKWFHAPSSVILVPTALVAKDLEASGFANLKVWTRGVDPAVFSPEDPVDLGLPRPVMLYAGRVSIAWSSASAIPGCSLPATSSAAISLGILRRRMSSCFRAGSTRSGWSCWRPWRAACRLPPIRCRGRWMWWSRG